MKIKGFKEGDIILNKNSASKGHKRKIIAIGPRGCRTKGVGRGGKVRSIPIKNLDGYILASDYTPGFRRKRRSPMKVRIKRNSHNNDNTRIDTSRVVKATNKVVKAEARFEQARIELEDSLAALRNLVN